MGTFTNSDVDLARNVSDEGRFGLLSFMDTVFAEADVLGAFVDECRTNQHKLGCIVDGSASIGLWHINISCTEFGA